MKESEFWRIIGEGTRSGDFYQNVLDELLKRSPDEIIGFYTILRRKIAGACTFPLLAANFAIESYVSDDGFLTFRAWLISKGERKFNQAIADPNSIADWLNPDQIDEIDGEPLLDVAGHALERITGSSDRIDDAVKITDPDIAFDWPENKAEYKRKWPKLVDKFWNDERIRELHP